MKAERSRYATGLLRISAIALIPALIASCTSSADPAFGTLSTSFAGNNAFASAEPEGATPADTLALAGESSLALPDTVAYVPKTKSGAPLPVIAQPAPAAADAVAATETALPAPAATEIQTAAAAPAVEPATAKPATGEVYVTASDPGPIQTAGPKKRSFLSSFFGSTPAAAAPLVEPARPAKPLVQLASADPKPVIASAAFGDDDNANPLPGVRQTALFEIKRKSGMDDDSDVDVHEGDEDGGVYQVASAAGFARLAPNGLLKQTDNVDVGCLKPSLVRVLKSVERHYGKKMVVTSGYRNPERNRRARGAKNSLHMYCAAVDVQIPGVTKWELAKYVRSMPGRGGVGTYCHTESVHIDVGPERDWNWRCRRRKG